MYINNSLFMNLTIVYFLLCIRLFDDYSKKFSYIKKDRMFLEESYVTFMFVGHVNFNHIENYIKVRHL